MLPNLFAFRSVRWRNVCSILLLVAVCLAPSFAHAQRASNRTQFPDRRLLSRFGLEQAWWNQATLNPGRDTVSHIIADEQVVFVQSSAGVVTAFDADTGRRLWSGQMGSKDAPNLPVTTNDQMALIVAGLDVFAVNKFTGSLRWRIKLPSTPASSPVTDELHLYIGMLDGSLYAFDLQQIEELYDLALLPQWSYKTVKWRYRTSKKVTTPPVPAGSVVFFASQNKSLHAVTREERALKFQLETDEAVSAPLAAQNGLLYMASQDNKLYCVNQLNGAIRWTFGREYPIINGPIVINDDLFVAPRGGGVYMLKAASADEVWWRPRMSDFVAANKNQVFLSDQGGDLAIVDRASGARLGRLGVTGFSKRFHNARTDRVVMCTASGLVVVLREIGKTFPDYHMYPERRPILVDVDKGQAAPAQP